LTAAFKYKATIVRLTSGIVLLWAMAGCSNKLVYHPKKETKLTSVTTTAPKHPLPPMPDEKTNDATLAGIDTTGIGVRDDVHIWIYSNYTTTAKQTALIAMGKPLQTILADTPKKMDDAKRLEQSYIDASKKLAGIPGLKMDEAEKTGFLLYEHIFNTPERLKTYLYYNLLLSDESTKK